MPDCEFREQERALFDLLFDRSLRKRFAGNPETALALYDLDAAERGDFAVIRPDALALDALLRTDLVLSHFCRAFPLSFSIVSSLAAGIDMLKSLVDTQTMRTAPDERAAAFGARLRDRLAQHDFGSTRERAATVAIAAAELGMAWTSAALKRASTGTEPGTAPADPVPAGPDWLERPLRLAPYVCAVLIPRSYQPLKQALCPGAATELWAHLSRNPLSATARRDALRHEDPRLLVARAQLSMASRCDPTVDQRTVELSEGFAPLFQHVDGKTSVRTLLGQLKSAGAPDPLLKSIQTAFVQLLETGMVQLSQTTE